MKIYAVLGIMLQISNFMNGCTHARTHARTHTHTHTQNLETRLSSIAMWKSRKKLGL